MRFVFFAVLALATGTALYFGLTAPLATPQHRTFDTSAGTVAVEKVAGPFAHPWAVAFLPGSEMLVTERGDGVFGYVFSQINSQGWSRLRWPSSQLCYMVNSRNGSWAQERRVSSWCGW